MTPPAHAKPSGEAGALPLDALVALEGEQARRAFFERHAALVDVETVRTLSVEVVRLVARDLTAASRLAETGRWLASRLEGDAIRARADRAAANVAHCAGDTSRAQALYQSALDGFLLADDAHESAITRSSALLNLAYLGAHDEADAWQAAARQTFVDLGDDLRLAILEHNYGNILLRRDHWRDALDRYRLAHGVFRELDRPEDAVVCLRNIAVCHIGLCHFDEAMAIYRRCREECQAAGLVRLVLEVDYNIASLYTLRGEYTRALRRYQRTQRRCEEEGDPYHSALCDLDRAEILLELNRVTEAGELARVAGGAFARLELPYERAKALTAEALAGSRLGQGESALAHLLTARRLFAAEGNHLWMALIDFYRGVVLGRLGRIDEALAQVEEARAAFDDSALAPRAAQCRLLIGELHLERGDVDRARATCDALVARAESDRLPALHQRAWALLGRVAEAEGASEQALSAYLRAIDGLERLRGQLQGDDLKIAFLDDKQAIYERAVWLCARQRGSDRARRVFDLIERAKSRALVDLLTAGAQALPLGGGQSSPLVNRIRSLREALHALDRRLDVASQADGLAVETRAEIKQQAHAREEELVRALRQLQVEDRELSSLQTGLAVAPEAVQAALGTGGQLVAYYVAAGEILAVLLDRSGLEVFELGPAAPVAQRLRALELQLSRARLATSRGVDRLPPLLTRTTERHLHALGQALLGPLGHRLGGEHLVIAPHAFLHHVPFHALVDGDAAWIDRLTISYAPSAGVLQLCSEKKPSWDETAVVLGVADHEAPRIEEEARAVATALPRSTLLLGEQADRAAIETHGRRCRYLHLATHGHFRQDHPMFSSIQLGNGRLSLFDLYQLELSAELVTLSGCATGQSVVQGGDELVGLVRGLLFAGAHSVMVSLWDVADDSATDFMRTFYRLLADGVPRREAHRRTVQTVRTRHPHPYHWAPFVLVGAPGS